MTDQTPEQLASVITYTEQLSDAIHNFARYLQNSPDTTPDLKNAAQTLSNTAGRVSHQLHRL
jgi:hypothetical protein